MNVSILLFDDFETLDVFGPVEILGRLKDHYQVRFYSTNGGLVRNSHGVSIETQKLEVIASGTDIFLIPGGLGTRPLFKDAAFLRIIKQIATSSKYVITVCTGSVLLAMTGLLDNRAATTNKRVFDMLSPLNPNVKWIKKARWTVDDKFYTSAGVSAGMDMTLGFLKDRHGLEFARTVAFQIEYNWQEDKDYDNFSEQ